MIVLGLAAWSSRCCGSLSSNLLASNRHLRDALQEKGYPVFYREFSGGHILGAVNLAAQRALNPDGSVKGWAIPTTQPDGTFKSVQELQALFDELGITRDREIITYCLRGGLSTHAWFVMTQLLGYPNVREYDRSWAEWGNILDLPIEQ